MINGLTAYNPAFLANVNNIQNRISQADQQMSSGTRVRQASDDPAAVSSILNYQEEIDRVTQTQKNLTSASTVASAADGALQNASSLMDQLVTLGAQGSNSTNTAANQANLALQVQQIHQQLVSLANTQVEGRHIFGGDSPGQQPYTYDPTAAKGVVQNGTPANTAVLRDASGTQIVAGLTAAQIFDVQGAGGASAPGNVFQAVYDLGAALQTNNQTALATAMGELKTAVTQVNQSAVTYGNTEKFIQGAQTDASDRIVSLQGAVSGLRDTNVAQVATELTSEKVALDAALSAHASLSTKSLFSYLG